MRLSHVFIDRPILATVFSAFVTLIGLGALVTLPIAQFPEIVPPTVQITTTYPGASAEIVDVGGQRGGGCSGHDDPSLPAHWRRESRTIMIRLAVSRLRQALACWWDC